MSYDNILGDFSLSEVNFINEGSAYSLAIYLDVSLSNVKNTLLIFAEKDGIQEQNVVNLSNASLKHRFQAFSSIVSTSS